MKKKIAEIADKINKQNKKIVLIAGPSSSGKTTFAKRLAIQLIATGKIPQVISLDDYYKIEMMFLKIVMAGKTLKTFHLLISSNLIRICLIY